jgi:hypothetical protein
MKIFGTVLAGSLIILSSAVFTNAQDDKNEGKPATQEAKPAGVKPEGVKTERPAAEDRRAQDLPKAEKQEPNSERKQENEAGRNEQRNDRKAEENRSAGSKNAVGDERIHKQNAQRIPDEKFKANFGREHHFRVSRPVVVEGRPQFQYSGYSFELVDVWPAEWSYSDDCYIDYVDGEYFLFDLLHPGARVAVVVVM